MKFSNAFDKLIIFPLLQIFSAPLYKSDGLGAGLCINSGCARSLGPITDRVYWVTRNPEVFS